jgi:hypothetical protein
MTREPKFIEVKMKAITTENLITGKRSGPIHFLDKKLLTGWQYLKILNKNLAMAKKSYLIQHPDYLGEKGKILDGNSHFEVALNYARYYNERSEYILFDEPIEITVAELDGEVIKFSLSAERSIGYHLVKLKS